MSTQKHHLNSWAEAFAIFAGHYADVEHDVVVSDAGVVVETFEIDPSVGEDAARLLELGWFWIPFRGWAKRC